MLLHCSLSQTVTPFVQSSPFPHPSQKKNCDPGVGMPNMPACSIARLCGSSSSLFTLLIASTGSHSLLSDLEKKRGTDSGVLCTPFSEMKGTCQGMMKMAGCQDYAGLCRNGFVFILLTLNALPCPSLSLLQSLVIFLSRLLTLFQLSREAVCYPHLPHPYVEPAQDPGPIHLSEHVDEGVQPMPRPKEEFASHLSPLFSHDSDPIPCDVFLVYSLLCKDMPDMDQCALWLTYCAAEPKWTICQGSGL